MESLIGDPRRFLSLLHHRTAHDFRDFALLDARLQRRGFKMHALPVDFAEDISCIDMSSTLRYGKAVPFNKHEAHRWKIIGFPRAKLLLEAQDFIYETLRKIVSVILDRGDLDMAPTRSWHMFVQNGCVLDTEKGGLNTYTERAFLAPPSIKPSFFIELARSHEREAQDACWLLQTDPVFAQGILRQLRKLTTFATMGSNQRQDELVAQLLYDPLVRARRWRCIAEEWQHVQDIYDRLRDNIHPSMPLPRKYERALCVLESMLKTNYDDLRGVLWAIMYTDTTFQKHLEAYTSRDGVTRFAFRRSSMHDDGDGAALLQTDPMCWCIGHLTRDPDDPSSNDHAYLQAFLDHCLKNAKPKDRARFGSRTAIHISQMAAVEEMLSCLRFSKPQPDRSVFNVGSLSQTEMTRLWWRAKHLEPPVVDVKHAARFKNLFDEFDRINIPSRGRSKEYFAAIIKAREKLMAIWELALVCVQEDGEVLSHYTESDRAVALELYKHAGSAEHRQQLEYEQDRYDQLADQQLNSKARRRHAKLAAQEANSEPLQNQWGDNVEDVRRRSVLTQPREKPKTRPTQSAVHEPIVESKARETHEPQTPSIIVHQDSMALFMRMFPGADTNGLLSGKTRWLDIVAAMADAGFQISESAGSAVSFEDARSSQGGRIVIHRPHPDDEVSDLMLRSIGKRMNRWFGWTRECFKEAN
ncbi:MAG: hypothetical protein Q9162_006852 [Coniocarpon cinnabarinum]